MRRFESPRPCWRSPGVDGRGANAVNREGRLDERRLTGALEREFAAIVRDAADAAWIGYAVRGRDRSGGDGCWDSRKGGRTTPVKLEGSAELFVLFRVESRAVGRIQIASPDAPSISAG